MDRSFQLRHWMHSPFLPQLIVSLLSFALRIPFFRVPYLSATRCHLIPKELRELLGWGIRRAMTFQPVLSEAFRTGEALIIYFSQTGNTEKVALAIQQGLSKEGLEVITKKVSEALKEDLYDYDLVCFGSPVIHSLPPRPVMKFILGKGNEYRKRKEVRLPAHKIPGKHALVFVTFSGPRIGVNEALPAGKYLRQFVEHLGFEVEDEWYIVGEFHGWEEGSIRGRLGDIRGRPNAKDLARIEEKTIKLVKSLKHVS